MGVQRAGQVPRLDDPVVVETPEMFYNQLKRLDIWNLPSIYNQCYSYFNTVHRCEILIAYFFCNSQLFSLLVVADKLRQLRLEVERCRKPSGQSLKLSTFVRVVVVDDGVGHSTADNAKEVFDGQNVFEGKLVDPFRRRVDAQLPEM